jgi:hypothetical protein
MYDPALVCALRAQVLDSCDKKAKWLRHENQWANAGQVGWGRSSCGPGCERTTGAFSVRQVAVKLARAATAAFEAEKVRVSITYGRN